MDPPRGDHGHKEALRHARYGRQAGEEEKQEEDGKEKKKQKTLQRKNVEENRPRISVKKIHWPSNRQIQACFRLPLTIFMAAAPEGADPLDFEAEEAAILEATKGLRLHLVVSLAGSASC